jgi:hypothetical protein
MELHQHHTSLITASSAAQLARRIVQWRYAERGELGCITVPYFLTQAKYKAAFAPFQALIEEVVSYDTCEGFSPDESQRFRCEVNTTVGQFIPVVVPWMRQVTVELLGNFSVVLYREHPLFEERAILMEFQD